MAYEQDYFTTRKYQLKQEAVERHVLEVLRWATKELGENLLDGTGKRALDIGCAYGYTSKVLVGLGYETVSIDISEHAVKQAKTRLPADLLVCDAQSALPFDASSFDLVACFDVLEHLPCPDQALFGMFDVCRSTLVCTTPNRKVEKPVRKLVRDYDETHVNTKTQKDWEKSVSTGLGSSKFRVEAFHDFAFRFGGKLFFKSFSVPTYGLTVRMAIRK
ncbi:MAG: class I SAM-dependent methyltransferase [Candidatus Bathyarchaeia archaeon]|jgi:2-polyprenyl-3-methyl-5-hydroxy-6-metoxy-1,4-benzoquinol methylase